MNAEPKSTYSLQNTIVTTFLFSVSTALILLAVTIVLFLIVAINRTITLIEHTGYSMPFIADSVQLGMTKQPSSDSQMRKNFLLLGLDSMENRPGSKPLTDTVILASLDMSSFQIYLVSLPRDLWSETWSMKINALYATALERNLEPKQFVTDEIEQISDVEVHHTMVVTLQTLSQLVDTIGGVKISVEEEFTDTQFPRSDVDVSTVTDPNLLYETVTFSSGEQDMNGTRALQFVRSRHAAGNQGTDDARAARQQKLIGALLVKLFDFRVISNPAVLQQLGKIYNQNFEQSFPLSEAVSVLKILGKSPTSLQIKRSSLPVFPENQNGIIQHPPEYLFDGQWVYTVRDPILFKQTVRNYLGYDQY